MGQHQPPKDILNIRHMVATYSRDLELRPNPNTWPRTIAANIRRQGNRPMDPRPVKNLLSDPLGHMPDSDTIDGAVTYIVDRLPGLNPIDFRLEPSDFRDRAREVIREHHAALIALGNKEPVQQIDPIQRDLATQALADADVGAQIFARSFAADYLIFRLIRTMASDHPKQQWSVAHMRINKPHRLDGPCWFNTKSPPDDTGDAAPYHLVTGLFYEPPTLPGQLYTVGRYVNQDVRPDRTIVKTLTAELRSTYLLGTRRPGSAATTLDMCGARLGPGRVMGEPRSYAIWCARLTAPLSASDQNRLIAQFDVDDTERLAQYANVVPPLEGILLWVRAQGFLSIQPPQIP